MQFKHLSLITLSVVASFALASPPLSSNKQGLAQCGSELPIRACCGRIISENIPSPLCTPIRSDGSQDDECVTTIACCVDHDSLRVLDSTIVQLFVSAWFVFDQVGSKERKRAFANIRDVEGREVAFCDIILLIFWPWIINSVNNFVRFEDDGCRIPIRHVYRGARDASNEEVIQQNRNGQDTGQLPAETDFVFHSACQLREVGMNVGEAEGVTKASTPSPGYGVQETPG
ncbi:hypothetical protein BJ165DRAFT_1548460 [Panaeolus papilionaceus]|nr:hypothetical protein BJ165DRAFT_1548460 [Panaeolus papilionaceus]